MTIKSKHTYGTTSLDYSRASSTTIDDILNDFKSLEEFAADVDIEDKSDKGIKAEYEQYHQILDYRRPKFLEGNKISTLRYNRSYTMQEIKRNGFYLKSEENSTQQKFSHHPLILSEFIL